MDPTLAKYRVPPAKFLFYGWQRYDYVDESAWLNGDDAFARIVEHERESSRGDTDDREHGRRAVRGLMMYCAAHTGRYAEMMPTLVGAPGTPFTTAPRYTERWQGTVKLYGYSKSYYHSDIRPEVVEVMARVLYGVLNYPQDLEAFLRSMQVTA